MLRFTTLNNKVVIDPSVLMIKEFTDIIAHFQKHKGSTDMSNKFLMYIFFCCDLTEANPLKDVDYRLKEEQANKRAFGEKSRREFTPKEQVLVDSAIDAYNFFNETALERATLTYDRKIDEIRSLLEKMRPESHAVYRICQCLECMDTTVNVIEKYVSNDQVIANFAKQLNELATYKLRALETAKKIENTGRVRGDKGSSLIERGAFSKMTEEDD